jgi:hypothetical protein
MLGIFKMYFSISLVLGPGKSNRGSQKIRKNNLPKGLEKEFCAYPPCFWAISLQSLKNIGFFGTFGPNWPKIKAFCK